MAPWQRLWEQLGAWLGQSLVRRTTFDVAAGLLAIIAIAMGISSLSAYYFAQEHQKRELAQNADTVGQAFANTLNGWQDAITGLARNTVLANALLDSGGREQYLVPFMREFDMHIEEQLGLTLCDFLARPLVSTGLDDPNCYGANPAYKTTLEKGQPGAFAVNENGHVLLVLLVPVHFPATNSVEGALVGRLDLGTWIENQRHIPRGYQARLHAGQEGDILLGRDTIQAGTAEQRAPRFNPPLDALDLRLEISRSEVAYPQEMAPLLLSLGTVALALLVLGIWYARYIAARISHPLLELSRIAQRISKGEDDLRAETVRQDEVGQLARSFNHMMERLEDAQHNLEAQVLERTSALTEGKRREKLRARELAAIFNAVPALVMHTTTSDSSHIHVNRALSDLLQQCGIDAGESLSSSNLAALNLRHFGMPVPMADWPLAKAAREGVEVANFASEVIFPDGSLRHLLGNAIPVFQDTLPAGAIAAFIDVTPLRQAQEEIAEEEERYRRLFELMPEGVMVHDGDIISMTNSTMAHLAGYDRPEQLVGQHILSFVHIDERGAIRALHTQLIDGLGQANPLHFRLIRHDGTFLHAEMSVGMLKLAGKRVMQVVIRDISLRRAAEEQTRLAARVFESSQDGIYIANARNHIISVNAAFTQRTGYLPEEVIGHEPDIIASGRQDEAFFRDMREALANEGHWENEVLNRHKNGELLSQWTSISIIRDEEGRLSHYIAVLSDVSEHKASAARMAYLAQHDYLTGLPNRTLLKDRLGQALLSAARSHLNVAVLFLDLDGFKQVNDNYGHAVGDQVLKEAAVRLRGELRNMDTVSRLGGDEFVVLLTDLASLSGIAGLASKLCSIIAQPYRVGALDMDGISVSIGIACYPQDSQDPAELIDQADRAMYRAKETGKNRSVFYATSPPPIKSAAASLPLSKQS
ncbi:MAG: diguanylate cyclase [Sulfuricella denitrificans]|nr:diguanylate cyclase [Sulfuricella denitrificans]